MNDPIHDDFLEAIELHSVDQLRSVLDDGLDSRSPIRERTPVNWLIAMYTRSDAFSDCFRTLLDCGAELDDPLVAPVLLNDTAALADALQANPALITHRTNLESAFTPLIGASLLHIAAEYGNLDAARTLIEYGADVNAAADTDEFGMNGHTPLFHTVNSHANRSLPIMQLLLSAGAHADIQRRGITWGKGMEWETTLFDVTPISYALFGLLPQMHRREQDIVENVRLLLKASDREIPPMDNIPNQYLAEK